MSAPDEPLVPLRIRLPYAAEQEFIARYGSNVSRSGIFIATRSMKPEGTALAFELVLKTGEVLLRGEAVVAKLQVESAGSRSGMTLQFVTLDARSEGVLERVLAQRASSSSSIPPSASGPSASPATSAAGASPGRARWSELSKRIDAALAEPDEPTHPASARTPETVPAAPTAPVRSEATPASSGSAPSTRPSSSRPAPAASARTPTPSTGTSMGPAKASGPSSAPLAQTASASVAAASSPSAPPVVTSKATRSTPSPRAPTPATGTPAAPSAATASSSASTEAESPTARTTNAPPGMKTRSAHEATPATGAPGVAQKATASKDRQALPGPTTRAGGSTPPLGPPTPAVRAPAVRKPADAVPTASPPTPTAGARSSSAPDASRSDASASEALAAAAHAEKTPTQSTVSAPARAAAPADRTRITAASIASRPDAAPRVPQAQHVPPPAPDAAGLPEPLALPERPAAPSGLVEPVLGVELTGTMLRASALASRDTGPLLVSGLPTLAAFQRGRWYVGRSAAERDGAVPLFAPPGDVRRRQPAQAEGRLTSGEASAEPRVLVAHLFAQLRREAEEALGKPVGDAVITVPSWFSYRERTLLAEACQLGGLQLRQIVHATSAACAAFAHGRGLARKRVLVLDGELERFEASVIQVTGEDLEVIATRGGSALTGQELPLEHVAALTREALSAAGATAPSLDEVIWFGDRAALDRTGAVLSQLLDRALPEPLDAAAVVRGAALLGNAYAELARGKRGGSVFEVLASPLSLAQRSGALRRVLEVGTRLPAEKTLSLPLTASETVALILCDGAAAHLDEGEVIGAATVESGPLGGELRVHLAVDRNGLVTVSTSIGGGRLEERPLSPTFDSSALLPLALPEESVRKSGFLRGLVERIGKG